MDKACEFNPVTGLQRSFILALMAVSWILIGMTDWITATVIEPALTPEKMMFRGLGFMLGDLLVIAPLTIVVWNKLVARIFKTPTIGDIHSLVIVGLTHYWF